MKKKSWMLQIFLVFCAVVLIIAVEAVYMISLNKMVSANTIGTIGELAEHDQNAIRTHIETNWKSLENIAGKFQSYQCDTIEELVNQMNLECDNSSFSHIYAVAEDGKIYTDKFVIYDPNEEGTDGNIDLLPYFANGEERVVARFNDYLVTDDLYRESILYGIRLHGFSLDGINLVGLVGVSDISNIQNSMVIESFIEDGISNGYSAVIDMNGNYIVNVDRVSDLDQQENFFDRIDHGGKSDLSSNQIAEKMAQGEHIHFYFTNAQGVKRFVCLKPLKEQNVNWYFLMSVDNTVITKQSSEFFAVSMIMMSAILLVITVLLLLLMSFKKKTMVAEANAKAHSEFLSNMSHEIRTPLNGIIGLIHLMEKDFDKEDSRELIRSRLVKARETSNYLLTLVNDVLDMSKLQAGKIQLSYAPFSPDMLVEAIWSMQKSNVETRGVEFILKKDLPIPWLMGDENHIKQIMMNIVSNAVKFTSKGGRITLSVSQVQEDENHAATTFVCSDTGVGMSQDFLDHIWDSFSQEHNKNSDGTKGTGLGMAICKQLVEAMDGEISVKSRLDEGSTFTVTFHSEIVKEPPECFNSEADTETKSGKSKVLIAEDNELNAEILQDILSSEGYVSDHACNGKEAVDMFAKSAIGEYGVILMDMQMPEMDGCQATENIRRMNRKDAQSVIIYACTANTFKEDQERAAASGMNDFLAKPIDIKILLQKLKR